jgi:hypothetical protein
MASSAIHTSLLSVHSPTGFLPATTKIGLQKKEMKRMFLLLLLVAFELTGCSKNNDNSDTSTTTGADPVVSKTIIAAGYGNSTIPMAGPYWQLPAGVQLTDSIHDYSYCWAFAPYTQVQRKDWKGLPLGFTFCFTLRNSTSQPITIPFPPELVFISESSMHQNVLVIDLGNVQLEAGAIKTIVAQGNCLNKGREIPQTYKAGTEQFLSYFFGPSQLPAQLQEVADILKPKHITINDILKADGNIDNVKSAQYIVIQQAIWEVTDENGLTEGTRKKLKEL